MTKRSRKLRGVNIVQGFASDKSSNIKIQNLDRLRDQKEIQKFFVEVVKLRIRSIKCIKNFIKSEQYFFFKHLSSVCCTQNNFQT